MKPFEEFENKRPKTQVEVDQHITGLLGDMKIATPDDLINLRNKIWEFLKVRPYNEQTQKHADSIQWKRTASEIVQDGYVYYGKACSDFAIVFLTLCRAAGVEGRLVKLVAPNRDLTHSIVEINLQGTWYQFDPSSDNSIPVAGELTSDSIWGGELKVWKKGRDVWDLELGDIKDEAKIKKEVVKPL